MDFRRDQDHQCLLAKIGVDFLPSPQLHLLGAQASATSTEGAMAKMRHRGNRWRQTPTLEKKGCGIETNLIYEAVP